MYNCIGFHTGIPGNARGIGDYFRKLDAARIPFVIKSVDDSGVLLEAQEIMQASDVSHIIMWRRSGVGGLNYDTPKYELSPLGAAEQHWALHMSAWPPELDPGMVWIETINEPDKTKSEWLAEFSCHTADLALRQGHKYAAFGWSYGEPHIGINAPNAWAQPSMIAFLRLCAANPADLAISLHEYSEDVSDITHGCPYHVGRFTHLFNTCRHLGIRLPTVFITELGWERDKVPAPEQAMVDIDWLSTLYGKHETIKGAMLWYLGGGFGGIADQVQRLIEPMTDYSLDNAPIPPPPLPDPEPDPEPDPVECWGKAREQYAREYWVVPGPVSVERRMEIYLAAAVEQKTVGPSYDDAGLGDLEDKTAVLFDIPPDQESIFNTWFETHYPNTAVKFSPYESDVPFYLPWPTVEKRVTQEYMARPWHYAQYDLPGHEGLDMAAPHGSVIQNCYDGIVYGTHDGGNNHPYGKHVRISHRFPDGHEYKIIYAHLSRIDVRAGDVVKQGQPIGLSGNTGHSDGPHLHLTLKKVGATAAGETHFSRDVIDPTPFFDLEGIPRPGEVPVPSPDDEFNDWPIGQFLAGVHGRADGGDPRQIDYNAVRTAKLSAVKLMSSASLANMYMITNSVVAANPFVLARLFLSFDNDRVVSPIDFAYWVKDDMQKLYDRGVRYFEIHNEPNLRGEGYGSSWKDGAGFALWFMLVADELSPQFPDAKFGFPGCSPGGDIVENGKLTRRDQWQFVEEAKAAVESADWIGVHNYWTSRAEMLTEAHGQGWKKFARCWPDKLLFITEFGNPLGHISKLEKGEQYRDYYRALSGQKSVGAAFCYVLSGSGWNDWAWVSETGEINEIPAIVGTR